MNINTYLFAIWMQFRDFYVADVLRLIFSKILTKKMIFLQIEPKELSDLP